jgi:UDP-N-acetylmuramoyl-tripeptide--D-alanyl-D-alanine ligase
LIPLSVSEIAAVTGGTMHDVPDPGVRLSGPAVCDSREAGPGGLFAAIIGEHADGHDFAAGAVAAGAVAVLASRPVPGVPAVVVDDVTAALGRLAREAVRRAGSATVIGVTGSAGKTSTKDLLAQVLEHRGPTVATARSFNTEIGLPLTVLRADAATRYLVLEMGARHVGDIAYLTGLVPPAVGLVINVGSAHVGVFGSRAEIARAKGELVEALPDAGAGGLAVLNADDELVSAMAPRTTARVLTYGRAGHADVRALDVGLDGGRARFTLSAGGESAPVALAYLGEHQVSNALGAAAVAWGLGMKVTDIAAALSAAVPRAAGRLEVTERPDGVTVVNDAFNANPDSMAAALATLAAMAGGRRRAVAVLGEMAELGADAMQAHQDAGQLAARLGVGVLVAVGGDGAAAMADAARGGGLSAVVVPDPDAALSALADLLRPGDIVLAKASHAMHLEDLAVTLAGAGGPAA